MTSCKLIWHKEPKAESLFQGEEEIPNDLKQQRYLDTNDGEVFYDHAGQLQQLRELESKGKKLKLILGRGNRETPMEASAKSIWVYGQIDAEYLVKDQTPHLYMDFDNARHLRTLPDQLFSVIAFDWSVVKFFRNMAESAKEFHRILKSGGKFYVDTTVGAFYYSETKDDFERECRGKQIFRGGFGPRYCLGTWDPYIFVEFSARPQEKFAMKKERLNLIKTRLEEIFGRGQCVPHIGSPVHKNNLDETGDGLEGKKVFFLCTRGQD